MKRFAVFFIFVLSTICSAQSQSIVDYQGEFEIDYSSGVGNVEIDRFGVHLINGIKIDDNFSFGLGFGVDGYAYLKHIYHVIPIYANLKAFMPIDNNITPYLSLSCGVGVGVSEYIEGEKGLILSPSIGVRLYEHYKLEVGYHSQRVSNEGVGINLGAIQLKMGFMF